MEYFLPDPSAEVRQGDVLVCRDLKSGKVEEVCLVITADCDISKGKFGRQLACLRIISLEEYVRTIWADRKLLKLFSDESTKIRSQIAKWHTRQLGSESQLSDAAAIEWIRRDDPAAICDALAIDDRDRKKMLVALSTFAASLAEFERNTTRTPLARYVAFRAVARSEDLDQCKIAVLAQAQNESLPDDVFLLTSLPQVELGPALVLLRELIGIPHDAVRYRASDATGGDDFLRVGRLQPTFKYAVSQAFAAMYSRIGLPSDYEARCKGAIARVSDMRLE